MTNTKEQEKPLELSRPKSPEEIYQEGVRKIAPQLRRAVRQMRIPAGAKFFYDALLDDTFMYDFGGNCHGSMTNSLRRLATRYGHNKDTLKNWSDILIAKEVIWVDDSEWPFRNWHISAIVPQPAARANSSQIARAKASAAKERRVSEKPGQSVFAAKNGKSLNVSEEPGQIDPTKPVNLSGDLGQSEPDSRTHRPKNPDNKRPENRTHRPNGSARLSEEYGLQQPESSDSPCGNGRNRPSTNTLPAGKGAALETSPDVSTQKGEFKSVQRVSALKKPLKGESAFFDRLGEVLGRYDPKWAKEELTQSGPWWRMKFREDADKMMRVLADVENRIKEGHAFERNPAAYAVDNWKRFA